MVMEIIPISETYHIHSKVPLEDSDQYNLVWAQD